LTLALIAASTATATTLQIPLDWEKDAKDSLSVTISTTDSIAGGCLDRAAKRALIVLKPKSGNSHLVVVSEHGQDSIVLPEGMWTTMPYKVGGEYRLAYQKEAVRTNSIPIMFKIDDHHVQEMRIDLEVFRLEPSRSFESMDTLSASFDPTRSLDKKLYELMWEHFPGASVWNVHLVNWDTKTYIATVPAGRVPLIYNSDLSMVWDVALFPRLVGEGSGGLKAVIPDAKKFGNSPDIISGEVGAQRSAFTFQNENGHEPRYGTYTSRLVDEKLDTKYLGEDKVVLPQIRTLVVQGGQVTELIGQRPVREVP